MIVGLAGESWKTIKETDEFLEELKRDGCAPDDVDFSILQIYPGSPFYKAPQDIEFEMDESKSWYKSSPDSYEGLVQVRTAKMTKLDLICARNYLERKWKPKNWVEDATGRKDMDRIYETIRTAEVKLRTAH